ncbi:hypothetical protein [Endozoicomonas sp. YOMI1]|uniref:hypothetical protein n=1 Tax=Endozoicomonas sp. YOMI1 TaxID=2828739 RepID=UPI0021485F00|nr:hypothetical protein [Endozoicomonas sp. YOMI1]
MDFYQVNGLTLQELHALIMESSIGFSAEDDSIQYLGRQIQLHDGVTELSEQTCNNAGSKQLFERLVNLQPDIKTQLPDSKAEAIQKAASEVVETFRYEAIEKSPNKEVLCAVFLECIVNVWTSSIKAVEKLFETNAFSDSEKLRIMLAAEERRGCPILEGCWEIPGIPLSTRLEEAKNLLQRLPDTPSLAGKDNVINERLTALTPDKTVKDGLLEIRQILESENNELSRQLLIEVDNIGTKFIPGIDENGRLSGDDDKDFRLYTRRLLYLYAACSGFSQQADIDELTSYIRTVLYTVDSDSIWHIVKELAYLSKQPGSIDYCRYVDTVANILTAPETNVVLDFEEFKQLSDINGFALLESQKTLDPYLKALRANIDNMAPEYSQALLPAVKHLESKFAAISLPEQKPDIKAEVHRLLIIIAVCKSAKQKMNTSVLDHFVMAIMRHGNKKSIPYLIKGLIHLVQSSPKIQQILGEPGASCRDHLRLAPLQLLGFVPDIISEDDFEKLCKSLQASGTCKRLMKDGKVFYQWLATLEQAWDSMVTNKAVLMQILDKLIQSLTYEKLGLLQITFITGDRFNETLGSMGLTCQQEGLPLLIAEKGAAALEGESNKVWQWLMKQRYSHLLPSYMLSITEYCKGIESAEMTGLIHEFIESSVNKTFIETRQSPLNNPHLQAVYRKYPEFTAGWGANFSDFSEETRNKLLSRGETLELTEDPWDLFISGLEVKTCQSPEGMPCLNRGLMSYVMDGRNAMIVRKNQKGNILSRSVIRMVLDQDDCPVLFLEMGYPDKSDLLFIDAAREIADEMELPLYHRVDSTRGEKVKLLEGRAPFDYFDEFLESVDRKEFTFTNVQRDVR